MQRAWRGRAAAAATALAISGVLVGCNPPPGQADITVTGAVEADDPPGSVTCRQPGDGGETLIPSWDWAGTIDGTAATFAVSSQSAYTPTDAGFTYGSGVWAHFGMFGGAGEVVTERVDADGTLHVRATLPPFAGSGDVEITAALRCPAWGHSTMTGAVSGTLDGVADCTIPSGSDAYSAYRVWSSNLAGQIAHGELSFAGLNSPAVDTALLRLDGALWGAFNQAGQPPAVEASVDEDGVLTVSATLSSLDDPTATIDIDATVTCA